MDQNPPEYPYGPFWHLKADQTEPDGIRKNICNGDTDQKIRWDVPAFILRWDDFS